MQLRHLNRQQYFSELANTSRDFYIDYLRPFTDIGPSARILEVGCGEGGNLLPFAEAGCLVTGIDLSITRIEQAQHFFESCHQKGTFLCQDFLTSQAPENEDERYDVIFMHDVIEHIGSQQKTAFIEHVKSFIKHGAVVFVAFPPWQMPFGGHQQIGKGFVSKMPYVHLLPNPLYRLLITLSGNNEGCVRELLNIKQCRMTIEHFETLTADTGFRIRQKTFWFINPHYKQKFHLQPRRLWRWAGKLPYIRNFYITSTFYILDLPEP